jgi:DNA repair protein RadA/Sms
MRSTAAWRNGAIASAARAAPLHESTGAFGEVGLTGRLRPASQAQRRLDECCKLGLARVVVPAGSGVPGALETETLRQAIAAALERSRK